MGKIIKYNLVEEVNVGTEEEPIIGRRKGALVEIPCTEDVLESNLAMARKEAFEEPTVEPSDEPEIYQPTVQEQLDAQAAAILELMGVIDNG